MLPKGSCLLCSILHKRQIRKSPNQMLELFQNNNSSVKCLLGGYGPLSRDAQLLSLEQHKSDFLTLKPSKIS